MFRRRELVVCARRVAPNFVLCSSCSHHHHPLGCSWDECCSNLPDSVTTTRGASEEARGPRPQGSASAQRQWPKGETRHKPVRLCMYCTSYESYRHSSRTEFPTEIYACLHKMHSLTAPPLHAQRWQWHRTCRPRGRAPQQCAFLMPLALPPATMGGRHIAAF